MIAIAPIPRALVPVDNDAADALGAPNYDEFQGDVEIWELIQAKPACLLRVTMAHCDAPSEYEIGEADSDAALARAATNMDETRADPRTREVRGVLWIYEIVGPARPGIRQIGLGGLARTDQIRTAANPAGAIIRNEGVRDAKARGRARLIERIHAIVDAVNNAVDDAKGAFEAALLARADTTEPTFETEDEAGWLHRVWLVEDAAEIETFTRLLAAEPHAYVADGNHRSAAAALLGHEGFVAVFFPARTLHIAPYNRLVAAQPLHGSLPETLTNSFYFEPFEGRGPYQPDTTHDIGLYAGSRWFHLRPRPGTFDPLDAAQDIDADIVQRNLFAAVFGIADPSDERLTFVGGNRDAAWLQAEVDAGRFDYAVTLAPVRMEQFIKVCQQNRMMPPKSTWFVPKTRTGLVMALLD